VKALVSFGRVGHRELAGLALLFAAMTALFALTTPRFWSFGTFQAMAFQLPELGLLTLAMLVPILSGGLNLAITFIANTAGLVLAWVLQLGGGPDAGIAVFAVAVAAALATGGIIGAIMGRIVATTGAHPILVSLGFMILLAGLGEFFTRGGDISGFRRSSPRSATASSWAYRCRCCSSPVPSSFGRSS